MQDDPSSGVGGRESAAFESKRDFLALGSDDENALLRVHVDIY